MKRWQIHFLGADKLPDDISGFEIAHFFSFAPKLQRAINARRTNLQRLALAVHVGFLRMTGGSLDAFERIPTALLRHLRKHLGITTPDLASLASLYRRRRTLYEHQTWAASALDFKAFTPHRGGALQRKLRGEALQTIVADELVQFARCWLYDNRILVPAHRRLQDICRSVQGDAQQAVFASIESKVPFNVRANWLRELLEHDEDLGASRMEWLQRPPKRRSPKGLAEVVEKVQYLESLDVHRYMLGDIRLELQRAYASRMRRRRPARFRQLSDPRKTIELVCWLRVLLMQLTDVALSLGGMQASAIERRARETVRQEGAELTTVLQTHISEACTAGLDASLSDQEARQRMLEILEPSREPFGSEAARTRAHLSSSARRTRPLLRSLLELPFQHDDDTPIGNALNTLRSLYEDKATVLPADVDISFASSWSDVIEDKDRRRALRGYEAAVLQALRSNLRSGNVWVDHSLNFRDRESTLMPEEHWKANTKTLFANLHIPKSASKHLKPLSANLSAALAALERAVAAKEVTIADKQLRLPAMVAEQKPTGLDAERRRLFADIGTVEWPTLITEMDSIVRFSWTLLGRAPNSEKELLSVYGALMAHGTELNAAEVALTIPGLSAASIAQAMHLLEDPRTLTRANQQVVDFLQSHAVAKCWGRGALASSDAMSLEASRHLWNARVDPRHRRHAVGMYTHVLDQWGIIYDQPIVLNQRQAGMAIEGMVRQKASTELKHLAVDTHGFTDFAMATAKLLSFDLCPRLKNLKHRRLHLPIGFKVPDALKSIVRRDVQLARITEGWDGLVRVVASIAGGWTSGMLALDRFGSASRDDPVHRAGTNLGKMYRTLFLCDYFTNVSFRRELLRILNHGESVHTLQRAIHFGGIAVARGRRHEELVAISGSLTLLSNLAMAWMTHKLQTVLDERAGAGRPVPGADVLRHIGPVHSEGINFRGRLHFPIKTYASRILAAA